MYDFINLFDKFDIIFDSHFPLRTVDCDVRFNKPFKVVHDDEKKRVLKHSAVGINGDDIDYYIKPSNYILYLDI